MTSSYSSRKKSSVWVDLEDIQKEDDDIPCIYHGWFTETDEAALWPGQRFSLALAVRTMSCLVVVAIFCTRVWYCSTCTIDGWTIYPPKKNFFFG